MADPGFNHSSGVAVHRLPLGLPRGAAREVCSVHMSRMSRPQRSQSTQSVFVEKGAVVKTLFFSARLLEPLPGVVPQKPVERAFKEQIEKYAPVLESYQLHRAAQYLRMLCDGALALEPLLKVSARAWPVFGKICPQKCVFSWPGVRSFLGPISRTRGRRRSITRHSSLWQGWVSPGTPPKAEAFRGEGGGEHSQAGQVCAPVCCRVLGSWCALG